MLLNNKQMIQALPKQNNWKINNKIEMDSDK